MIRARSVVRVLLCLSVLLGVLPVVVRTARAQLVQPQENPILLEIELTGARRYRKDQLIAALGHPLGIPLDLARTSLVHRPNLRSFDHKNVSLRQ